MLSLKTIGIEAVARIVRIGGIFSVAKQESYFPNEARKSYIRRLLDNFLYTLKYGEVFKFYTLYGLDLVNPPYSAKEYMPYRPMSHQRDRLNQHKLNQTVLLRDKYLFYMYLRNFSDVNVPEVFAIMENNSLVNNSGCTIQESALEDRRDYFIKEISGECASCVIHIRDYNDFLQKKSRLNPNGKYIFQDRVFQHSRMSEMNPCAVNTIRIVTISNKNGTYVFDSLLRIGTEKSDCVDNWAAGGIAVSIGDNGFLHKKGYFKPGKGNTFVTEHPDSKISFESFQIPFYKEVVDMVCNAHKHFYNVHSIGWDIAITEDGPVIIEGNDNWEISLHQAANHPLKNEWIEAISNV